MATSGQQLRGGAVARPSAGDTLPSWLAIGLLGSLAAYLACACTDAVHTVGQLEDATTLGPTPAAGRGSPPSGSSGGDGSSPGSSTGSGSTGSTSGSGATPGSAGTGVTPSEPFDAAVITDPDVSCEGSSELAVRERLDLYLLIDRNVTLAVPWRQITDGLASYVDNPQAAGTGVGVSYFPALEGSMQEMCEPDTYVSPDTMIAELPGNAAAIKADRPLPLAGFAGSPTAAALTGALEHAASRRNGFQVPQAVVLITDATQDFVCFTEARDLERVTADARNGAAAVPTYVVALTVPELQNVLELLGFAPLENLDSVAASGGTGSAREVSLNLVSDISETIAGTLLGIQYDAEPCRYEVPQALRDAIVAGSADATATVLGTGVGDGTPLALPQLDSQMQCGQGYWLDDPIAPVWATLCPLTCAAVKSGNRDAFWLTECR